MLGDVPVVVKSSEEMTARDCFQGLAEGARVICLGVMWSTRLRRFIKGRITESDAATDPVPLARAVLIFAVILAGELPALRGVFLQLD